MTRAAWIRCILLLGGVIVALVVLATYMQVSLASAHQSSSEHTLKLIAKTNQNSHLISVIERQPGKLSLGDLRIGHAPLYNEQGTQLVGRIDVSFSVTDVAAKPGTIALTATRIYTLPGGTIVAEGVSYRSSINSTPPDDVSAIIGGTGQYVGVRGQVHSQAGVGEVTETFDFES
jgi:hypothetical protein